MLELFVTFQFDNFNRKRVLNTSLKFNQARLVELTVNLWRKSRNTRSEMEREFHEHGENGRNLPYNWLWHTPVESACNLFNFFFFYLHYYYYFSTNMIQHKTRKLIVVKCRNCLSHKSWNLILYWRINKK